MYWKMFLILLVVGPVSITAQSVKIDVEYQPQTTYQWTRTLDYDRVVEYIGAEDFGDWFEQMGWEAYAEIKGRDSMTVTMSTKEWNKQKLPYIARIDTLSKDFESTSKNPFYRNNWEPLETHDLEIAGVINHLHRIEIDSIDGVDSLYEKNRVFKLLDDIHRNLKYPKESFALGQEIEKVTAFSGNDEVLLTTGYLLESLIDNIATFRLTYSIASKVQDDGQEVLDENRVEGEGVGRLKYDIASKQVVLLEFDRSVNSFGSIMDMIVETKSQSKYRWTMKVRE